MAAGSRCRRADAGRSTDMTRICNRTRRANFRTAAADAMPAVRLRRLPALRRSAGRGTRTNQSVPARRRRRARANWPRFSASPGSRLIRASAQPSRRLRPSSTKRCASAAPCVFRRARLMQSSARPDSCTRWSRVIAPAASCAYRRARSIALRWSKPARNLRAPSAALRRMPHARDSNGVRHAANAKCAPGVRTDGPPPQRVNPRIIERAMERARRRLAQRGPLEK